MMLDGASASRRTCEDSWHDALEPDRTDDDHVPPPAPVADRRAGGLLVEVTDGTTDFNASSYRISFRRPRRALPHRSRPGVLRRLAGCSRRSTPSGVPPDRSPRGDDLRTSQAAQHPVERGPRWSVARQLLTHLANSHCQTRSASRWCRSATSRQQPDRIGLQRLVAVQQVLQHVVVRIADVGLGVDEQPRATLRGQHVAGVQIGEQQHVGSPVRDSSRNSARPSRASPASSRRGSAASAGFGEAHPLVRHGRQRTERVVGRQVDGPDRPQQVGDDDVLLGLGTSAQLGPWTAPLEEHRRGVAVRADLGRFDAECSNAYTSTAP